MSVEEIASTAARVKAAAAQSTERLLTLQEIQRAANVSRVTVYRWTHERGLRTIRVGGCVRVRESDWLTWLAEHSTDSNGEATA
jgi:excisionase family DNA binding protein